MPRDSGSEALSNFFFFRKFSTGTPDNSPGGRNGKFPKCPNFVSTFGGPKNPNFLPNAGCSGMFSTGN